MKFTVDCEMCEWSYWNDCTPINGNCGRGHQTRTQRVCVECQNGGNCGCQQQTDTTPCSAEACRKFHAIISNLRFIPILVRITFLSLNGFF